MKSSSIHTYLLPTTFKKMFSLGKWILYSAVCLYFAQLSQGQIVSVMEPVHNFSNSFWKFYKFASCILKLFKENIHQLKLNNTIVNILNGTMKNRPFQNLTFAKALPTSEEQSRICADYIRFICESIIKTLSDRVNSCEVRQNLTGEINLVKLTLPHSEFKLDDISNVRKQLAGCALDYNNTGLFSDCLQRVLLRTSSVITNLRSVTQSDIQHDFFISVGCYLRELLNMRDVLERHINNLIRTCL